MTREDIRYLLTHTSYNDVGCYIKEIYWPDFCTKFDLKGITASLGPPTNALDQIPDLWLDLDGEIVFNNMSYQLLVEFEQTLDLQIPRTSSDKYDEKRSRGGSVKLVASTSRSHYKGDEQRHWLNPHKILTQLSKRTPYLSEPPNGDNWAAKTLRAVAERGFECRVLI